MTTLTPSSRAKFEARFGEQPDFDAYGYATLAHQHRLQGYTAACEDEAKRAKGLVRAAQAVIDRWDTPLWKDAPATAVFINALRAELKEYIGE